MPTLLRTLLDYRKLSPVDNMEPYSGCADCKRILTRRGIVISTRFPPVPVPFRLSSFPWPWTEQRKPQAGFHVRTPKPVFAFALTEVPKRHRLKRYGSGLSSAEVNLMTGDGRAAALVVARQVGIAPEGVWTDMRAKGKASTVEELTDRTAVA